jgi:endonuclease I
MKNVIARFCLFLMVALAVAPAARGDVLVSELCDPRLNYLTDRYIEIWNSGPAAVSLTGWQLVAVGNGADIFTWNLSGTIQPGQAMVAGDDAPIIPFTRDFIGAAWNTSDSTWNGGNAGDGVKLKNASGTIIDYVYNTVAYFTDATLVRNANVTTPSATYIASQWTATAVDTPTQATPGVHNPVLGPSIAAIATIPATPHLGDPVDVQATVTDGTAAISSVTLNWGTVAGSLVNVVPMTNTSGSTYLTSAPIPAQAAGATVYFTITAINANAAQTVSPQQNFGVPNTVTIAAIQGAGASSPLAGQTALTTGVVTAAFGTTWVIQDGTGARSGLWVTGAAAPAVGSQVEVSGVVQEVSGNTTLTSATISSNVAGSLPAAEVLATGTAAGEDWEGVLVQVVDAACTLSDDETPAWAVSNSGGAIYIDDLGVTPALVLGTRYSITGPVSGSTTAPGLEPRDAGDIVFVADTAAPQLDSAVPAGATSIRVSFSEDVSAATAGVAANYAVTGCTVTLAVPVAGHPSDVTLTVTTMVSGSHTLTVNNVADLYGNAVSGATLPFSFYGGNIPAGYYDTAAGLIGEPLRGALHAIIDNHHSISYAGLWTAFYTTDDKPNGKVWDMYSDVPGGTPPYEYTFGVDQGGSAGSEGTGYNREHSFPASWFGSNAPMYTDLFQIYPTDNDVNNRRSNYPYGEVTSPTWTSLNGCRLGPCTYPGYTGVVFEPIDAYKGDFARGYFYMSTRYYTEDSSWPGSPMVNGSQLLPWAEAMLLEWNALDPVSQKEIDRNEAIYAIQGNRNPFIDRPDFVQKVFQPELSAVPLPAAAEMAVLRQNVPNPFNPSTVIRYELSAAAAVELQVYDLAGRLVRTLYAGQETAGAHECMWQGRDDRGHAVAAGVYVYRLRAGDEVETRRMVLAK